MKENKGRLHTLRIARERESGVINDGGDNGGVDLEPNNQNAEIIRAKVGKSMIQEFLACFLRILDILDQINSVLIIAYIP